MPPQAANPEPPQQDADRQYYIRVLNEALELGLQRLRCLDDTAAETNPKPPLSDADAANIYDRVTRSMRRSIMLADRLARDPAALTKPDHARASDNPEAHLERAEHPRPEPRERAERLEAPERLERLPDLPTPDLVRLIYRDLDLPAPPPPPHWPRPDAAPSRAPVVPPFILPAAIIAPRSPSRRIPDH